MKHRGIYEHEVPERQVLHDLDDDDFDSFAVAGEITVLPMSPAAKAAARRSRERLDEIGGFGFGRPVA